MSKRKVAFEVFENVEIGPAVAEGNCIVRIENRVVFVKFAAPGDIADIQIVGKKKKFLEAKIIKLHKPSPLRVAPFCEHYTLCGGCKWQHLDYNEQLRFKQQQVIDSLERIGGLSGFEVLPILGSKLQKEYRNKLELTFSSRAWVEHFDRDNIQDTNALGFHMPGRFDKILDVNACHLMPTYVNEIHRGVKRFSDENVYEYFNINDQVGYLRNLMMRCNSKGEWMVLISFYYEDIEKRSALLNFIRDTFDKVVSLVYVINDKRNDTLNDLEVLCYSGKDHLIEELGGLKFKVRPQSFFQTNTYQAEVLYSVAKDFAGLSGDELVYDLYTGTGSIALYVSDQAKHVVGIEYVEEAIMDANENMALNSIDHAQFYAGDMKEILTSDFILEHGRPDVVITDPPRDGMHPDVVHKLLEMEAKRIVYVSCNPATQARDAQILAEKYDLVKVQPVDMFPHTHHVENVGLWVLR